MNIPDIPDISNSIDYKSFCEKFIYNFKNVGIDFDEKIMQDFYIFTNYLTAENKKYNLTAITDTEEIIIKHFIDSVIILKYFDIPKNSSLIDIGTGAGFPSVPLYIMRKDLKITFLDSSNKKINFIKKTLNKLGYAGYADGKNNGNRFFCGRAEDAGKDLEFREKYDFALSRAVAKLNVLCELAAPLLKHGGYFIAYKSKNAEAEILESEKALKIFDLKITQTIEFNTPQISQVSTSTQIEENKRVLIKIEKTKKTSSKYPRNFSDITRNPL